MNKHNLTHYRLPSGKYYAEVKPGRAKVRLKKLDEAPA